MTTPAHGCTITGDTDRARENFYGARNLLKKNYAKCAGKFSKKFLKLFFGNKFSMEIYFLDHMAFAKFFLDPVQELHDLQQAPPPTFSVVASSKITLYYSADPGFHWNLSRVTTCPDHFTRRG
jgi:hypothetical protein